MRVGLILIASTIILTPARAISQSNTAPFLEQTFQRTIMLTVSSDYLLYLPQSYNDDTTKMWPLVLFLHGKGERGKNLELVKRNGPTKSVAGGKEFEFILLAPQCPDNDTWSVETLRALLDEVEEGYRVDSNRIYLTGLSLGGWGIWNLAIAYPERFAAIAPVCGRTDRYMVERVCRLNNIPTWVFHGAKDDVVPLSDSEAMVKALQACGGDVKFTVYPDANHNSWDATYDNPEFYEWLLSQRRE